ncbi:MAG: CvpA family protein [Alphaproteobacteria bacterium]|nr:CvpA family protein [Alphaproteobacteria bacterium]
MTGLNALDGAVIVILLLSGIFAFLRGFVHELLALGGWVGASFIALYGLPLARPIARSWISLSWAADIAAGGLLFVGALAVFALITHAISGRVRESQLSALDRTLGFGFGVLRGALIVCLAWLVLGWLLVADDQPSWIRDARTRNLLDQGADILVTLAPSTLSETEKSTKEAAKKAEAAAEAKRMADQLMNPQPKTEPNQKNSGYNDKDRTDLDRLIKSKQ